MSQCQGTITTSTKVDREMVQFLNQRAEHLGVSRAELLRRLFDQYHESHKNNLQCPYCENTIRMEL